MQEQTFYYEYPDGSVAERVTAAADPVHPAGATLLTQDEYDSKRQAIEADLEQRKADVQAQESAQKKNAYDALVAAGFSADVAQTLSGYKPQLMSDRAD
ncbi:hypothetical protein [Streptomyces hokutonensis]|uniref:hypothetical protein n=1 Tax=Streptomyces hokutonensis TaxID=1306990 RepID=UPI00369C85F7